MPAILFYIFAAVAVVGAVGVVVNRNPVSSAFSMIGSFLGVAALFMGLNAYFIGTIQVLVYAGAIMVLFLFIIMLLDLKAETNKRLPMIAIGGGIGVSLAFLILVSVVLTNFAPGSAEMPQLADPAANDVKQLGQVIFTDFNFQLQIVGVLLLVATVGVVVLSKRELN